MSGGPMQPRRIAVNGKYIGAPLNGVHRTAARYTRALLDRAGPTAEVEVLSPRAPPEGMFAPGTVGVRRGPFGAGQGWEMLTLPRLARGRLLVNFCNVGPLLHGNSVVMIHDAQTFLYPGDYTGRQAVAYRALLPLIGRRARRVLTVSEFSRRSLAEHGIAPLGKIDVVHNGTDHLLDAPADPGALARFGLIPGGYALTLGSPKSYKNMGRLFAAFADPALALPLVLAGGPGREAYDASHGPIPDKTVFTGRIEDGALRALYEGARLFVFPSRTEGFGLPPVEAMHCGTPVVAARAGAVPEVCDGAARLVDPEDTGAWRSAIASVVSDDGLAGDLIARGRQRAASLTWERAGARLWECLDALANG